MRTCLDGVRTTSVTKCVTVEAPETYECSRISMRDQLTSPGSRPQSGRRSAPCVLGIWQHAERASLWLIQRCGSSSKADGHSCPYSSAKRPSSAVVCGARASGARDGARDDGVRTECFLPPFEHAVQDFFGDFDHPSFGQRTCSLASELNRRSLL